MVCSSAGYVLTSSSAAVPSSAPALPILPCFHAQSSDTLLGGAQTFAALHLPLLSQGSPMFAACANGPYGDALCWICLATESSSPDLFGLQGLVGPQWYRLAWLLQTAQSGEVVLEQAPAQQLLSISLGGKEGIVVVTRLGIAIFMGHRRVDYSTSWHKQQVVGPLSFSAEHAQEGVTPTTGFAC